MADVRSPSGNVRYAVVGCGHIAQTAVLPAFAHAERVELAALVSGSPEKLRRLGRRYRAATFSYDDFDRCLAEVDAVFIAVPNALHALYAVRAAEAGVHVLCEKPLAASVEDAERMVLACREAGVRLMTAYRLHFEPINLEVVDLVARGTVGEPKFFAAEFSMIVRPDDVRTKKVLGGGSVFDLGIYCINAARYVFRAEPREVMGYVANSVPERLPEVDESTAGLLSFEHGRLATFVSSFNAADVSRYRITGTEGDIVVDPAFDHSRALGYTVTVNGKSTRRRGRRSDQFAPELTYFADCVLEGRDPEPSGLEGLQDVRIVQAVYESAEIGKPVELPPYEPAARPSMRQRHEEPPVDEVEPILAEDPSQ